jgi:hypothetical protein
MRLVFLLLAILTFSGAHHARKLYYVSSEEFASFFFTRHFPLKEAIEKI